MIDAERRNTRVQKVCEFCNREFLADRDDTEKFCEDHRGAGL